MAAAVNFQSLGATAPALASVCARPFTPTDEGEDMLDDLTEIRKQMLFDTPMAEDVHPAPARESPTSDPLQVFLRIRPPTKKEQENSEMQAALVVKGDTQVVVPSSKVAAPGKIAVAPFTYTFSRIFEKETKQPAFFAKTALPMVQELLDGYNSLLFTYGVTNSGKTFTVLGAPENEGILPRSLDVIFNSIKTQMYSRTNLRPRGFSEVTRLTAAEESEQARIKEECMLASKEEEVPHVSRAASETSLLEMDSFDEVKFEALGSARACEATSLPVAPRVKYAVFVSYAEIYNENIFDLLEPPPRGAKRVPCKLGEDTNSEVYVKGLREIQVNDRTEAFRLLRAGQRHRRVAATNGNTESSRSHCVFTIKMLRIANDEQHSVFVSRMAIVDLAGSERYAKTNASGARLKEAGNINTSLMTLGKCLDVLRANQASKGAPKVVPFRESKLTRLFQNYFLGKGSLRMIININTCASNLDETHHALKFSALARQVTVLPQPIPAQPQVDLPAPAIDTEEHEALLAENEELRAKIADYERRLGDLEMDIRAEVADEMAAELQATQQMYQAVLLQQSKAHEENYEKRLTVLTKSVLRQRAVKRVRVDDDIDGDEDDEVHFKGQDDSRVEALEQALQEKRDLMTDLQEENTRLRENVVELEASVAAATMGNTSAQDELAAKDSELTAVKRRLAERDAELAALQQTHQRSTNVLNMRLETQEKMIHTLKEQIPLLEAEIQRLNSTIVDLLEEETQRDLNAYAITPAGAELIRTGSIVSNKSGSLAPPPGSALRSQVNSSSSLASMHSAVSTQSVPVLVAARPAATPTLHSSVSAAMLPVPVPTLSSVPTPISAIAAAAAAAVAVAASGAPSPALPVPRPSPAPAAIAAAAAVAVHLAGSAPVSATATPKGSLAPAPAPASASASASAPAPAPAPAPIAASTTSLSQPMAAFAGLAAARAAGKSVRISLAAPDMCVIPAAEDCDATLDTTLNGTMTADTTLNETMHDVKENRPARSKRVSKVHEALDELLHTAQESVPLKATKKRKFFKKGDIRSPNSSRDAPSLNVSRVERLLTPIARRLRNKKA
eukprot:m.12920 g.12920  ORF g.12920 m.12920 type:complete len:1076 (-) comp6094_c0_seq1:240-3467(-)